MAIALESVDRSAAPEANRSYRSPAVGRAFSVLRVLAEHPEGLALSSIARLTGVPPSTLLAILGSLCEAHAVSRVGSRQYRLDFGIFQLGQAYVQGVDLMRAFEPVAGEIMRTCDETVQLAVLAGCDVMYVGHAESSQPMRLVTAIGRRAPVYASGAGKALLVDLEPAELRSLLGPEPFEQITPSTLTTYEDLELQLEKCRSSGLTESREECIVGLHCVGAPIRDHTGTVIAAMSMSVPIPRMTQRRRHLVAASVWTAARTISRRLGYRG
jgi:IclR family transcriptional regulator, KDG regulon repressor